MGSCGLKLMQSIILGLLVNPISSQTTIFSTEKSIVIQILPEKKGDTLNVHGRKWPAQVAYVFLPKSVPGSNIVCTFDYFQDSCSLLEKWIFRDNINKVDVEQWQKINRVILTIKKDSIEKQIKFKDSTSYNFCKYFLLDIQRNIEKYKFFDCQAFTCILKDVKLSYLQPNWTYSNRAAKPGDVVVLATGKNLPDAIQHFALYIGDGLYLSKFGRSGGGTASRLEVMSLNGMKNLYNSQLVYTAFPKNNVQPWTRYKPPYKRY